MRSALALALALAPLAGGVQGCGAPERRIPAPEVGTAACPGPALREEVTFQASDGHELHGTWQNPCGLGIRPAVVLIHQLCRDRREWADPPHDWIGPLHRQGIATLAFDLRGHGGSKAFADGSTHDLCREGGDRVVAGRFAGMVDDVRGAVGYVRDTRGSGSVALVGSSIGANSALTVFAADPGLSSAILLSPGLEYRGIRSEPPARSVGKRPVLLFAARDDQASAAAVEALKAANPALNVKVWSEGGHGNALLAAHPDVLARLVEFLADRLERK